MFTLALCLIAADGVAHVAGQTAPLNDADLPWASGDDPIGVRREDAELDRGATRRPTADAQAFGPKPPALSAREGDVLTAPSSVRETQHRVHIEWRAGLALTTVELHFVGAAPTTSNTTHTSEVKYRVPVPTGAALASLQVCLPTGCRDGLTEVGASFLSAYDDAVQARGAGSALPVAHARTINDERGTAISLRAAPVRADQELVVRVAFVVVAPVRGGVVRLSLPARGVDERAAPAEVTLDAPDLISVSLGDTPITPAAALLEPWRAINLVARLAKPVRTRPTWLRYDCGDQRCARVWFARPAAPPSVLDVAIVLDASASMRGPARGRIAGALAALLALLPPERPIDVALFAAAARVVHAALPAGDVGLIPLVDASQAEDLGAGTRILAAWEALQAWRQRPARARGGKLLVVLGDGTVSRHQDAVFDQAARSGVAISWVNLGDRSIDPDLQRLVRATGGITLDAGGASASATLGSDPGALEEELSTLFAPAANLQIALKGRTPHPNRRITFGTLRHGSELSWSGPIDAGINLTVDGARSILLPNRASRRPAAVRANTPTVEERVAAAFSALARQQGSLAAVDPSDLPRAGQDRPRAAVQCDPRGPALRSSGISTDADPVSLAEARPCRAPSAAASADLAAEANQQTTTVTSGAGTGMPASPLLSMLRQRILPVARACFRRDRAGRAEYELRAVFELELSNQEVTDAVVTGEVPEPLRTCLIDAADRLEVPLFTGAVRARYPLRTQSEPLPEEIELSPAIKADLDRLLDGNGGALHTPPAF